MIIEQIQELREMMEGANDSPKYDPSDMYQRRKLYKEQLEEHAADLLIIAEAGMKLREAVGFIPEAEDPKDMYDTATEAINEYDKAVS